MNERGHGYRFGWYILVLAATGLLASACAPAMTPVAPAQAAKAPEPPPSQRVYLSIDSDTSGAAFAESRPTCDMPICEAPCNRVITIKKDAQYRIIAPNAQSTRAFVLYSPQDPVVYLQYEGSPDSTNRVLRGFFLTTLLTGTVLMLGGLMGTPFVKDEETRTAFSAVGFTGLVLALPLGAGVLGPISGAYSESNLKFLDPATRPDLRDKVR